MVKIGTNRRMVPCLARSVAETADKLLEDESSCETLEIQIYSRHVSFQCTGSPLVSRPCRRNAFRKGRIERTIRFQKTGDIDADIIHLQKSDAVVTNSSRRQPPQRGDRRVDKVGE